VGERKGKGKLNGKQDNTFKVRHLCQGKDIARGEFVPYIPCARGTKVLFLVDFDFGLGCRCAPVWNARHGISGLFPL